MVDDLLHLGFERLDVRVAGLPLRRVAQFVERADNLEQRVRRALADTVVVVGELTNEFERRFLDIWQEVLARGREHGTDSVRRDLLLDADRAVHVEELVDVEVVVVLHIDVRIVVDVDCARRGETRSEVRGDIRIGSCIK